jgi:surface carbohydrate biosynthesis protein (TIGR04326 family)
MHYSSSNNILSKNRILLVWDSDLPIPTGDFYVLLWSAYVAGNGPHYESIPAMIERNSSDLRSKYLEWVYDLGEAHINGKRVIDCMELSPGFSYWWMTSFAHKPNFYEGRNIDLVIKCFALEEFLKNKNFTQIKLVTRNKKTKDIFQDFCLNVNVDFRYEIIKNNSPDKFNLDIFLKQLLHRRIKAILYLILAGFAGLICSFRFKNNRKESCNSKICFFDILIHLQNESFVNRKFVSNYWTKLPLLLKELNLSSTWIHGYFQHKEIRSINSAQSLLEDFNKSESTDEFHVLVEAELNLKSFLKTIYYYCRLIKIPLNVGEIRELFTPKKSNFNFWVLFKDNWFDCLAGTKAINNCIKISVYEEVLKKLPKQSIGFYIQENQPWEMALLNAWKLAGHGTIIGVPHTTIRFWDLRYFYDYRTYDRMDKNALPMPDRVALNGPVALKAYLEGGYTKSDLFEVEALRYLHFPEHLSFEKKQKLKDSRRVLVCGDNIPYSNEKLMTVIQAANDQMLFDVTYTFKPHKAFLFDAKNYVSFDITVSDEPLSKLLMEHDVIVVGNITSAAVDAYQHGLLVATLLDGESLNASPLREMDDVKYFTNATELVEIITKTEINSTSFFSYFYLNKKLPRWRNLLDFDK